MTLKELLCFHLVLFSGLLLAPQVCSKKAHGNPAKDIVDIINRNRTSRKLPSLYDNPGLGCMALQYAAECKGNCTSNNTLSCQPLEDDFTEVFAPDCGVELPTFDLISGILVGCRSNYLDPSEAFSEVLVNDKNALSVLGNKTHTEVGVGVLSAAHKHWFLWCILFSSGQTNSSFMLDDHGLGIKQREGCFSGTNTTCNQAYRMKDCMILSILSCIFTLIFLHLVQKNVDNSFYL